MSSPSLASLPPQNGQAQGAGMTTRSRGRCCRQGRAHRPATGERLNRSVALGDDGALGRVRFQFLELQFKLVEQLAAALGGLAILIAPQLGDDQLQVRDHRGARGAGFGGGELLALLQDQRVGLSEVVRQRRGRAHASD